MVNTKKKIDRSLYGTLIAHTLHGFTAEELKTLFPELNNVSEQTITKTIKTELKNIENNPSYQNLINVPKLQNLLESATSPETPIGIRNSIITGHPLDVNIYSKLFKDAITNSGLESAKKIHNSLGAAPNITDFFLAISNNNIEAALYSYMKKEVRTTYKNKKHELNSEKFNVALNYIKSELNKNLTQALVYDYLLTPTENKHELADMLMHNAGLKDNERELLILRYGIGADSGMTMQEIAEKEDTEKAHVSAIIKKGLKHLRENKYVQELVNPAYGLITQTAANDGIEYIINDQEKKEMEKAVFKEATITYSRDNGVKVSADIKGIKLEQLKKSNKDFSVRLYNILLSEGIQTLGDLDGKTYKELYNINSFGKMAEVEIERHFQKYINTYIGRTTAVVIR